jgi:Protein of unknown function (DUF 659)
MCLTSDAFTNISNDPIVNYMAVSPETNLFLESVCTGEQGCRADWIAQDLKGILEEIINASGAITNNTKANQKAWKILERYFPSKFVHGFESHGLHLLVKDIFAATKTKKGGSNVATYPVGYPFKDMLHFAENCKEVVKFFQNHHAIKAKLNQLQQQSNTKHFGQSYSYLLGIFRRLFSIHLRKWASFAYDCYNTRFFKQQCKAEGKVREHKNIINTSNLVIMLQKALQLLKPIDYLIKYYQNDKVQLSDMYDSFILLEADVKQLSKGENEREQQYLQKLVKSCYNSLYGDSHGILYLLDPRYLGKNMKDFDFKDQFEEVILSWYEVDPTMQQIKWKLQTLITIKSLRMDPRQFICIG